MAQFEHFFYFFCDHTLCLCLISLRHGEFLQSCTVSHIEEACVGIVWCHIYAILWCLFREFCTMSWASHFGEITPPNMEQNSVSIVCTKFDKAIFGYIRQCVTIESIATLFLCFVNCCFLQSFVLSACTFSFSLFFCGMSQTWLCFEVEGKSCKISTGCSVLFT